MENEHAVLGAIIKAPDVISEIDLVADDFSIETYRTIYTALLDMSASRSVIDVLTISDRLDRSHPSEQKWMITVGRLYKDCISTANVHAYAALVKSESRTRKAKEISIELINGIDTAEDDSTAIDKAIQGLMELSVKRKTYEYTISQAIREAIERIDEAAESDGTVGIRTGLKALDETLSGFHESDLIVVAGRPAMGKTAVLLNFLDNSQEKVGLISAEQPYDQIGLRLISINGSVNSHLMRTGGLDDFECKKVSVAGARMHTEKRIWINDRSGITILELIRQARKWKHEHDIKALYVDYIQRIKWTNQNLARWEQVGNVVMALKELARELQIPVIALAQVNRNVEQRENKRPHMGDIANSSEIEKEADVIMTIYRDEVYNPNTVDTGIIELDVAKNRHGPTGSTKFVWDERYMKVKDLDLHNYAKQEMSRS
jgi:replicative DNA helicase